MSDVKYSIFAIICGIVAAIITFIIAWKISNLFISRRDKWGKSAYAIFMMKLSWAGIAAYWAFTIVISIFAGAR
jgi:hypothetical protein